jgi:3-hydroxy-9,10-secoandrosta-1,3,5(10)-triene-9,17-dione monooxygenase
VIGSETREALVRSAVQLRPLLLEQQAQTEERSYFAAETHELFRDAGFYRLLTPRRYGGLEVDIPTFYEVMIAIARGCPSTGWQLCLSAGHALQLASYFSERAQDEIFGAVDGEFIAPLSFGPQDVQVRRVDGGRIVSGTWHFASGIPYATHHMGLIHEEGGTVAFVTPHFRRLDDWGDLIGLKGSGSHSVVVEEAFVPDHHVVDFDIFQDVAGGTPGSALHGNPRYAGQFMAFAMGELNSVQVGAAQAMLDEAERILLARPVNPMGDRLDAGGARRAEHPDYQRAFGLAMAWTDAAESIMLDCGRLYHAYSEESAAGGTPFAEERTMRVYGRLMTVQKLTWEAGDELFRTASSSGARDGARMQRYWRDLCAFRTNGLHQLDFRAPAIARAHFGMDVGFAR